MKHNVIISMRVSLLYENTPYRRIIQKEMKRIAPIVLFMKGSIINNFDIELSGRMFRTNNIYIYKYKYTYIYIRVCMYN